MFYMRMGGDDGNISGTHLIKSFKIKILSTVVPHDSTHCPSITEVLLHVKLFKIIFTILN